MKIYQLATIAMMLVSFDLLAQKDKDAEAIYVSKANFPVVYNQALTPIITGSKDLATLGDYVGVDVSKPSANVNIFKEYARGGKVWGFLSGNFSGGVTDNVMTAFSNDKFNTGFAGRVNFSFVIGKVPGVRPMLWYTKQYLTELQAKKVALDSYIELRRDSLKDRLDTVQARFFSLAKMEKRSRGEEAELLSLQQEASALRKGWFDKTLDDIRADSLKKLELSARYSSRRISWFDLYVAVNQERDYLFDASLPFADKISKVDFTGKKVGLSFNYFFESEYNFSTSRRWVPLLNGLVKIDYELGYGNNVGSLNATETSSTATYDSTGQKITQSLKVNTYNASEYKEQYYHLFRFQLYRRLTKDKSLAIHPYYEIKYTFGDFKDVLNTTGEIRNAGVGLILTMKNKTDEKAKISIEPYLTFKDLKDSQGMGNKWSQRNEIGIRTGVPLSHIFQ